MQEDHGWDHNLLDAVSVNMELSELERDDEDLDSLLKPNMLVSLSLLVKQMLASIILVTRHSSALESDYSTMNTLSIKPYISCD
jgi:hypothetical protein